MHVPLQQLQLPAIVSAIGAIGGLGAAAFGVLEALKPFFGFINRIGLGGIQSTVAQLTPPASGAGTPLNALTGGQILRAIEANWINGRNLADQKAIAKSLIKLHLSADNAAQVAAAANVDPAHLVAVARSAASGAALTAEQSDAWSRFDLIVTAMLDECYQRADQIYRNWMRAIASGIAVVLAVAGGCLLDGGWAGFRAGNDLGLAVIAGLLATPFAPIAKDLSTALATAVNTMQAVKNL
ncbi:MAG TPA: hypothetical protein VKU93_05075 [Terracidiphilus sp.]|jgi:hypothetical protein|nr:hypothetical protein [Terracidiphilus sp.]